MTFDAVFRFSNPTARSSYLTLVEILVVLAIFGVQPVIVFLLIELHILHYSRSGRVEP